MDKKILEYNKMKYVFMLPDGYEEGKKYPVIILLPMLSMVCGNIMEKVCSPIHM